MPRKNQFGTAQIIIWVSDQGNTGTGPELTDSILINITIIHIYEIPKLFTPYWVTINEDTNFNLEYVNCSITTDVDPNYGWLQLTISTIYGNLSFDGNISGIDIYFGMNSIIINDTTESLSSYFENVGMIIYILFVLCYLMK